MRLVVALGGNALLERGEPMTAESQRANVARAAQALAPVVREHEVVITHGNGPQVGLLALQAAAYGAVSPYPLDVLGAESQGMIGYLIEQELVNELGPGHSFATLLTQVLVDATDPAFANPSKPIGPVYPHDEGEALGRARGWPMKPDGGGLRRVVASPLPIALLEAGTVELLVKHGITVICAGGGGIPVVRTASGAYHGVEAVIDKDRASQLTARMLGADGLVMLTDVAAVEIGFGTPGARAIRRASPEALAAMAFEPGSMGPKVEAACAFVHETGGFAAIGELGNLAAILEGGSGTRIERGGSGGHAAAHLVVAD